VLSDDRSLVGEARRFLDRFGLRTQHYDSYYSFGVEGPHLDPLALIVELEWQSFPVPTVGKYTMGTRHEDGSNINPDLFLEQYSTIPVLAVGNFAWDKEDYQNRMVFARKYHNQVFFCLKGRIATEADEFVRAFLGTALDTPLGFGAVVRFEGRVADGQLIRLIEPAYSAVLRAITANPAIMYQIGPRDWEEIIAASYEKAGFDEIVLTPRSGDLGRDVVAIKRGFGSIKFIEQVKAYKPGHRVNADEVRALLGVLHSERDASKAVFSTTSEFAPRLRQDRIIAPYLPHRLELIDREALVSRLTQTIL